MITSDHWACLSKPLQSLNIVNKLSDSKTAPLLCFTVSEYIKFAERRLCLIHLCMRISSVVLCICWCSVWGYSCVHVSDRIQKVCEHDILQIARGNFTKFTCVLGDKNELIRFWDQKVNSAGHDKTKCCHKLLVEKCTFSMKAYRSIVCCRRHLVCYCYCFLCFFLINNNNTHAKLVIKIKRQAPGIFATCYLRKNKTVKRSHNLAISLN